MRANDDEEHGASIVGMWHTVFTGQTLNGASFSGVVDNAVLVFHSDGTEIMNSSRPAQDGNFCLGVWERTGRFRYQVNHIAWQGNDPSNAPSGIGLPRKCEFAGTLLARSTSETRLLWTARARHEILDSTTFPGKTESVRSTTENGGNGT